MPGGFRPKAHIHIRPVGFCGLDLFRRAAGKTSGKLVCGVCTPPDQHAIKSKNEIIAVSALCRHCRRGGSGRIPTEPGAMCGLIPCPKGTAFRRHLPPLLLHIPFRGLPIFTVPTFPSAIDRCGRDRLGAWPFSYLSAVSRGCICSGAGVSGLLLKLRRPDGRSSHPDGAPPWRRFRSL